MSKPTLDPLTRTLAEALGANVTRYRLAAALTQADLARRAGMSTRQILRIEGGTANSSTDTIDALARALDVDPMLLLGPSAPLSGPVPRVTKPRKPK